MKSAFYEPYKYWDPFIERDDPPDDEDSPFEISQPLSSSISPASHAGTRRHDETVVLD